MLWKRLGKEELIYLNQDDDNQDDVPDKDIATTITLNENDLALIFPGRERLETTGTLTLECPGNAVRFWDSSTKGTSPRALPLTWVVDGSENDLPCLYIEGINPGKAEITLTAKDPAGKVMGRDRVKVGVVGIAFTSNANTAFGYDNGTVDDNPTTAALSEFNPPQKYDWVNTEASGTTATFVTATITPASLATYVWFTTPYINLDVTPEQATGSPQEGRILGGGGTELTGKVCTRLGSPSGAPGTVLNAGVYPRVVLVVPFQTIIDSQHGISPNALDVPLLQNDANTFLRRGVAAIRLANQGTSDVAYDLNTNGQLDIYYTLDRGPEWQAIVGVVGGTGLRSLYLHRAIRIQDASGNWGDEATGFSEQGSWIVLTDQSTSRERTLAHEFLHNQGLTDTGPLDHNTTNVMYFRSNSTKYFVGYFTVEQVETLTGYPFTPRRFEVQWDSIRRQ